MTSVQSIMPTNPTPLKGLLMLLQLTPLGLYKFIFGSSAQKMDDSELLDKLIEGKSFVRWGDGETANLREKSTWHQSGDKELSRKLAELIDFCSMSQDVIFGINFQTIRESLFNKHAWDKGNRNRLLTSRALFNQKRFNCLFNSGIADALYFYNNYKLLPHLMSLIASFERPILVINSDSKVLSVLKDWNRIEFIGIKPRDAFKQYDEIERRVETWLDSLPDQKEGLLLLSGGSATKVLVTRFSKVCQIIDIGSGFSFAKDGDMVMDWDK